jgi:hypothetical protein|tara:strand:+ start:751 stop:951 length:201 start_codon:yes stop_codon:yes gene_type:complete
MTKDMKLNERLKQELTDYKGLRSDLSFVHRGRVYQSPIWSIERGAFHLVSYSNKSPDRRTMVYLKG